MNIRWKSSVVAIAVCASMLFVTGAAHAASHDSPPPLPAPTGVVVTVSTESQLQNAVRSVASNTTIMIAPGTYTLTSTLYLNGVNGVTLRGATNNRDDVVLVGRGMNNSSFGSVESGVWTNGQRNMIANLTIRDVWEHGIHLNDGAAAPRIYNVHLINAGTQFIKASSGSGTNDGIVEFSVIEYSSTARSDYTNGIDVHVGKNWIVRNNLFRNITAPEGSLAGPAVLFWNTAADTTVEGNTFIDSQREISIGLLDRAGSDHTGGVVRNNFIVRRAGMSGDVGILIADSPNTQVLHNTILLNGTYPNAIEYRFSGTRGGLIANNLASGAIQARDGAAATVSSNYLNASSSMFVNAAAGDLHLRASAAAVINKVSLVANALTDWDGQTRPGDGTVDYGADELGGATDPPSTNQPPSVSLTAPGPGAVFAAPATIALAATASDSDGTVSSVSFYNGSTLLGADSSSPYTFNWTNVQAGSFTLTAVAADNGGASTTSSPVNVTVGGGGGGGSGGSQLPSPWSAGDIGAPAVAGRASYASGAFAVQAGGADIWNTSDQFHFVYRQFTGDVELTARVESQSWTDPWAKAGVMIRAGLEANSAYAATVVTPSNGLAFQRRTGAGEWATHTWGPLRPAPRWVRLVRRGSTFSSYESADGSSWTLIGTDTISIAATAYIGLAVTSHNEAAAASASFTGVSAAAATGNVAPSVTLTAPANGAIYPAPASVTLAAGAGDSDGSVARVDFYQGASLVGSATSAPYSYLWANVPAGSYSITAVATDNVGATTRSGTASLTVAVAASASRTLAFTPSADNDSNVSSYTVEIFSAGNDPATASPAASRDLGKPAAVAGTVTVDVNPIVTALGSGSYFASVTAVGPGGRTRGAPSNVFAK